jgi:hypothetical protein
MFHPQITNEFENDLLVLIDEQDKYTRSDLQDKVTILVNKILEAGQNLPSNKITPISKFYVLYQSPSQQRPEVVKTVDSAQEARQYLAQSIHLLSAKTVKDSYSIAQGLLL